MSQVSIEELTLADEAERWAALGFDVDGDVVRLATVDVRMAGRGAGRGLAGWSLAGAATSELDGLPTSIVTPGSAAYAPEHPNGVVSIDHIVAVSPDFERTVGALVAGGLDLRRVREEPTPAGAPRQAFFRLGGEILEVVAEPDDVTEKNGGPDRPAFFWGLALLSSDIDRTAAALGEHAGEPRPAVQPGRRIATVRRSAGLSVPVAIITPRQQVGAST